MGHNKRKNKDISDLKMISGDQASKSTVELSTAYVPHDDSGTANNSASEQELLSSTECTYDYPKEWTYDAQHPKPPIQERLSSRDQTSSTNDDNTAAEERHDPSFRRDSTTGKKHNEAALKGEHSGVFTGRKKLTGKGTGNGEIREKGRL